MRASEATEDQRSQGDQVALPSITEGLTHMRVRVMSTGFGQGMTTKQVGHGTEDFGYILIPA